ncbi:GNAT family N-acetyltransferase [Silvanigrella paludirubra]|uniref:GNAT family N-acetyltransferase n=1 Tax=Silvanigrella paludirubra TaxID=2499159 RepID=A0A6N6VYE1_9BACT|nr:GNAT family N-acetyltransferase [Silvanigrella paludirubra]KAB8041109.1 GNAT family N-acetyltransferase [Silvanigrella paludirubra]
MKEIKLLNLLSKSDIEIATNTLTSAFEHDPCLRYILNSNEYHPEIAFQIHKQVVKSGLYFGHALSTSKSMEGVSVWMPPTKKNISIWDFILSGGLSIPIKTIFRMNTYENHALKVRNEIAIHDHWYLFSIGVHKEYQGKSYGTKMLKPILDFIDQRNEYCYLETHNPNNIAFYEKHGFELKNVTLLPKSNTEHYAMYRSPKK